MAARSIFKFLLFTLLLYDCAKRDTVAPGYTTDNLLSLVQDFQDDFDVSVNFEVVFVDNFTLNRSEGQSGSCEVYESFRRVEIISYLENDMALDAVVYHELGHCALNLAHYTEQADLMKPTPPVINFDFFRQRMIENYESGEYQTML